EGLSFQHDKVLNSLVDILESLTKVGNVTLIGWQNIYNSDGTLLEIRTIELTLLNENPSKDLLEGTYVDVSEELPVILDLKNDLYLSTGILLSGSVQQFWSSGHLSELMVVNQNQDVFVWDSDIIYGLKNITVTSLQSINSLVKILQSQTNLPVNVLKFNVDGNLEIQNSIIVPQLLGTVLSVENATLAMVDTALLGLSLGELQDSQNIQKFVGQYMQQHIPGYSWLASKSLTGVSKGSDLLVNLKYQNVDIGERPILMTLYGTKL
ncbi:hypothetical protein NQ318_014034, partial [Aromia moschata]